MSDKIFINCRCNTAAVWAHDGPAPAHRDLACGTRVDAAPLRARIGASTRSRVMRLRLAALAAAILASTALSSAFAETGGLEIQVKARGSADASDDQKVTLYKKSKALVIGMDHYGRDWPQLSNGVKDAEEVARA